MKEAGVRITSGRGHEPRKVGNLWKLGKAAKHPITFRRNTALDF